MKSTYLFLNALCLLFVVAFCLPVAYASNELHPAHIASPKQYALLLENDSVVVLKMVLKPGEADLIHSHRNETVYFQKGGKLRIIENGKAIEVEVPDGHVMWHEAWTHQVTNIGSTEVIAVIVEEK